MYRKRIALDLAKEVFQIAEAERSGAVSAQKRLSRAAFVRYVKPYRQRNKTDRNDCDAILEAARACKMHPVPIASALTKPLSRWPTSWCEFVELCGATSAASMAILH